MKNKIFISLTVCFILLFSMGIVFADDNISLEYDDSTQSFDKQNNFYYNEGRKDIKSKNDIQPKSYPEVIESKSLNVTNYFQSGEDWSTHEMKKLDLHIGTDGCLLTSFTMVNDYYGSSHNPGEVNNQLGENACPFYWYNAASIYNLTLDALKDNSSNSYAKTYIKGALRNNKPVIVGFEYSSGTHYVVARGFDIMNDGTEYYYIHDPASTVDHPIIQDYLDDGYNIHRLAVYTD